MKSLQTDMNHAAAAIRKEVYNVKKYILILLFVFVAFVLTSCSLSTEERIYSDLSKLEEEYSKYPDLFIEQLSEINPEFKKIYAENEEFYDSLTKIEDDLFTLTHYFDEDEDVSFSEASEAIEHIREVLRPYYW